MTSSLRLLLWLKWTLTWRGYRRSKSQIVGAILFLIFLLPLAGFCAYGLWTLLQGNPLLARPITRDALSLIALLWVLAPLLGFSLNDAFDVTRLFVYPISSGRIFWGALLGGLLDRSALLVLPVLAVILALLCPTPAAFLLTFLLLILFLIQTLAVGQAAMLLLIGFLRSRRFRDITIVLFPLIGLTYYLSQRLLMRRLEEGTLTVPAVVQAPAWHWLDWLPPGWTASGIVAAQHGHFGSALLSFALLLALTAATVAVAAAALQTLYRGDIGPSAPQSAPARAPQIRTEKTGTVPLLPADAAAMAWKEWAYFQRDPQYKALAVQSAYTLVMLTAGIALPSLRRGIWGISAGGSLLLAVSGVLLLSLVPLLFNQWAGEGAAITALFSMPTSRRAMILGKNAAHGALLVCVCALGLIVAAVLTHAWADLPLTALWVLLAAPLLLAAGNLVSARFPHRMLVRGQRWGRGGMASAASDGAGSGCAYSFLYVLAYGATLAALVPVLAAVAVPGRWGISSAWHLVTLPLAALYSLMLYWILLGQAETWLLAREPEIVARIVPE